jgi:hypothetical protein
MMKINLLPSLFLAAGLAASAYAGEAPAAEPNPFADPAFQDCIETTDGYLNSKNTMNVITDFSDFRDSPISAPAPTLKNPAPAKAAAAAPLPRLVQADGPAFPAGHYKVTFAGDSGPVGSFVWPVGTGPKKYAREYVFISVTPAARDYSELLPRLEAEAGFRFVGEKTAYTRESRRTVILGWAPAVNLIKIGRLKGVQQAAIEKKSFGVPLKAKVRFTLKVPYQNRPNAFVPGFIKQLTDESGFSAENWFRLPQKNGDSKFSVFDVTGSLPVDMIGELSRSPFVASVEFNDASL